MSAAVKPWLILAVIFVAGGFTGAALTMVFSGPLMHAQGGPPPDMKQRWLGRLTHELNLTPDQQAKIGPILDDTAAKVQKIHQQEFESIRPILKASDDQIAALLTPDQQARMKELISERENAFHNRHWGNPRDGGPDGGHFHGGGAPGGPGGGYAPPPPAAAVNPPPPPPATNAPPH